MSDERYVGRNVRNFANLERSLAQRDHGELPPDAPSALAEVYELLEDEATLIAPYHRKAGLEHRKWKIIHKFIHDHPFDPAPGLTMSQQWQAVRDHYAHCLGAPEVLEWVAGQAEVHGNLERGIRDMRPRRRCRPHVALLEFVANRKRKAHAVLHFALAELEADPSLDWEVEPEMIERWRRGEIL